jgi:RimJ/RimL family protein N-acetyltransferase
MRTFVIDPLVLEPQVAAHAEAMFQVLSDPAIYEYENEPPPSIEWLRDRFARLEARQSPDGHERWLNWVIKHSEFGLIGYVQATVHRDGRSEIAYVLSSPHWGHGFARASVQAMITELHECYQVQHLFAVLKQANFRSQRLLERLGFALIQSDPPAELMVEPDEVLMHRARESAC